MYLTRFGAKDKAGCLICLISVDNALWRDHSLIYILYRQ